MVNSKNVNISIKLNDMLCNQNNLSYIRNLQMKSIMEAYQYYKTNF